MLLLIHHPCALTCDSHIWLLGRDFGNLLPSLFPETPTTYFLFRQTEGFHVFFSFTNFVRTFWTLSSWFYYFLHRLHRTFLFQRVIGLFSSKDEPVAQFTTNDIEMTTFSVVSGQSPKVLPAMCCSAARSLVNTPQRRGAINTLLLYGLTVATRFTPIVSLC